MALLLTVGLLAARRFANRAIAPIEALGHSAQALGAGAEVHYAPAGWAELDSVAHHLADASTRIRHAQTEMEARVAAAIAATERAQSALLKNQKLEALGRLTGGIAHEYNNLLQTLTTALQLAAFSTREDKVKSLIQTCQRTVARATTLTGQLGSFGRLQAARLSTVDVCEQLRSAVQLMKGSLRSDVTVEVHCEEDVWPVTLEPLQFDVALLNLALNARDAMPAGGLLRLDARNVSIDGADGNLPRGDYVLVSMVDSGSGMQPDVMARALDPFFTTKPPGQGTGLGLPQAYAFAAQAGGTLILDSIPGIGTRVDMYLARAQAQARPRRRARRPRRGRPCARQRHRPVRGRRRPGARSGDARPDRKRFRGAGRGKRRSGAAPAGQQRDSVRTSCFPMSSCRARSAASISPASCASASPACRSSSPPAIPNSRSPCPTCRCWPSRMRSNSWWRSCRRRPRRPEKARYS